MKRGSLRKSLWNRILVFMMVLTMTSVHLTPAIPALADTLESTAEQGSGEEKAEKEESSEKEEKEEKAESSEKEEKEEKADSSEKEEREEKSESSEKEEADTSEKEEKAEASEKEEASDKSDAAEASEASEDNSSDSAAREEAAAQEEKGSDPTTDTADEDTSAESAVEIVKAEDAQAPADTDAAVSASQVSEKEEKSEEIAAPADSEKSEAPAENKAEAAPAISAPAENVTTTADGHSTIIAAPGAEKALTANIGPAAETTNVQEIKAESDKNEVSVQAEEPAAEAPTPKAEAPEEKKLTMAKSAAPALMSASAPEATNDDKAEEGSESDLAVEEDDGMVKVTYSIEYFNGKTKDPADAVAEESIVFELEKDGNVSSQGKLLTSTSTYSKIHNALGRVVTKVDGKNVITYTTTYKGIKYTLAGDYLVEVTPDEDGNVSPVFAHSDEEVANAGTKVYKVELKNDGTVIVTYNENIEGTNKKKTKTYAPKEAENLYFAPVYIQEEKWLLEHKYIDNISTGSGSWSNQDWVTEYKHTFKEPEAQPHYEFLYWENENNGEQYQGGDSYVFTEPKLPEGESGNIDTFATKYFNEHGEVYTERVNTYAWWQPSITVNYLDAKNGSVITVEDEDAEIERADLESFDDIDVDNNKAAKTAQKWVEEMVLGSNNTLRFLGWFVKKDNTGAQGSDNETVTRLRSIPEEPVALADSFEDATDGTAGKLDINELEDGQNVSGGILEKLSATKDRVVQSAVSLYAEFATWFNVSKTWNDDNDRDGKRPESIQVQLLANDKEEGTPITLTKDGDWKYTFDNLKAFDDDGNLIKYSIRELAVADYTSEVKETLIESENERVNGLVKAVEITNTHAPEKIEFTISKTWEDENNKDNIRPDSIEVSILADGEVVKTVEISSKEDWEKVVGDMYRYAEGKEIEYTVAEAAVEGYEATISGSAGNGFGINNIHEPAPAQDPTEDPTPAPAPNNGGNSGRRSNSSERTYSYSASPAVLVASNEPAVESAVLGADREPVIEESAVLGADREPQQGVLGADRLPQTGQLWWPIPILLIAGAGLLSAGVVRRREDD
ncbi:MAG: Cna B-type domain-containing protein [Lachnospiraceae bacterium]|nr:Cna B-type domain-containing protein [Lachnospiraceae bacterium]